nr:rhomboid family intramembrane serine protease [Pseudothermotoga thermarum]
MFFLSSIPVFRNQAYLLIRLGAQYGPLVSGGEWYRVITAMFVHGGLLHLLFNSYALFYFGTIVESIYGTEKFVIFYLLAGAVGNLATHVFYYRSISVGASGAIFGLVGILFALGFRRDTPIFMRQFTGMALLPMIIFNVVYGFMPGSNINNAAHLGGFLAGMAIGYFADPRPVYASWKRGSRIFWKAAAILSCLFVAFCFFMLIFFSRVR